MSLARWASPTFFVGPATLEVAHAEARRTMSVTQNDKSRAGSELLRVIEQLEREKGIPRETAFTAIERAVRLAIGKHYGDEDDVVIQIDRTEKRRLRTNRHRNPS